jgi:DnaJ-domain-containing protein 1
MSVDAILKEIASLTDAERAELKARMSEQFPDASAEEGVSPELAKLLDERIAAANANPAAGVPWEVVYEESLKRARR